MKEERQGRRPPLKNLGLFVAVAGEETMMVFSCDSIGDISVGAAADGPRVKRVRECGL